MSTRYLIRGTNVYAGMTLVSLFAVCILALVSSGFSSTPEAPGYTDEGRRDPFIALVTTDGRLVKIEPPAGKNRDISIQGIVYDPGGDSYVIAHGDVIGVGGTVGEYKLVKIEPNQVTLSRIGDGELKVVVINKEGNT